MSPAWVTLLLVGLLSLRHCAPLDEDSPRTRRRGRKAGSRSNDESEARDGRFARAERWSENIAKLEEFKELHGGPGGVHELEAEYGLGKWLRAVTRASLVGKLPPDRAQRLSELVSADSASTISPIATAKARRPEATVEATAAATAAAATSATASPTAATGVHPLMRFIKPSAASLIWHASLPALPPFDGTERCRNDTWFIPAHAPHMGRFPICVRTKVDVDEISNIIAQRGSWPDCSALPSLWFDAPGRRSSRQILRQQEDARKWYSDSANAVEGSSAPKRRRRPFWLRGSEELFFDVGANIGACTVEVLLRVPEARVIAVEPSASNLFYLTSSLVALGRAAPGLRVRERVLVVRAAVGNASAVDVATREEGNYGATSMGSWHPPLRNDDRVAVRAFDDVIETGRLRPYASLLKMDVEGFECRALQGMRRVLGTVGVLQVELSRRGLELQGCGNQTTHEGAENLLGALYSLGFNVETEHGQPVDAPSELSRNLLRTKRYSQGTIDLVGRRRDRREQQQGGRVRDLWNVMGLV